MNNRRRISLLAGIVFLCATASFAQQVKTDYDRNADFNKYKTYSWENVHTANALWVDRIKAAVNSALAAKGWTQVDSGGDVSISVQRYGTDRIVRIQRPGKRCVRGTLKLCLLEGHQTLAFARDDQLRVIHQSHPVLPCESLRSSSDKVHVRAVVQYQPCGADRIP